MKPDEARLLTEFAARGGRPPEVYLRDLAQELNIPSKRACFLAKKWAGKDWYDWGVTIDLGWLSDTGMQAAYAHLHLVIPPM